MNTASRMESTSMAFRIHSSETTAGLLEEIGGFHMQFRGITEIKVRGFCSKTIEFNKIEFIGPRKL